jgi:hypothetical protein
LKLMSRTEKKILGEKSKEIVDLLKKAYCDDMQIFYFFGM